MCMGEWLILPRGVGRLDRSNMYITNLRNPLRRSQSLVERFYTYTLYNSSCEHYERSMRLVGSS